MSLHHMGSLLKRSTIASFNHRQTYTGRNLIEQSCGRIGKHVSPLDKVRLISLDSEFGIPLAKNSNLKVDQLKIFQENFNVMDSPNSKVNVRGMPAWKVMVELESTASELLSLKSTADNLYKLRDKDSAKRIENIQQEIANILHAVSNKKYKLNHTKLTENQFNRLSRILNIFSLFDKEHRNAESLSHIIELDATYETCVNLPIAKLTLDNESYARVVGTNFISSGFVLEVANRLDLRLGNVIKTKITGVKATASGFIPIVKIEGKDIGNILKGKRVSRFSKTLPSDDEMNLASEANKMASKFGFVDKATKKEK